MGRLGGSTLSQVQALHNEGLAMEVMIRGAAKVVQELHRAGKLDGIITTWVDQVVKLGHLNLRRRKTVYGILHG